MKWSHVQALIAKDLKSEIKDKYALGAIFLFVICATFIVYKSFQSVTVMSWNVLYWIIFLFSALNALVQSFGKESRNQYLYYYQLAQPGEIIIAKIIYNVLVLFMVAGILYVALTVFTIDPVVNKWMFFSGILLGSIGVSICFTFVASVLGTTGNQSTMMAILALPLVIPILLLLIKISANALDIVDDSDYMNDFLLLGGIDLILLSLCSKRKKRIKKH